METDDSPRQLSMNRARSRPASRAMPPQIMRRKENKDDGRQKPPLPSKVHREEFPSDEDEMMSSNQRYRYLADSSSDTSSTVAETLSVGSDARSLCTSRTRGYKCCSQTALENRNSPLHRRFSATASTSGSTGPIDVDEMKPVEDLVDYFRRSRPRRKERPKTGPVDVDDCLSIEDDSSSVGEEVDCEYDNGDDDFDDSGIPHNFVIFDDDSDFDRQLMGYEVGFEPPVVTEVSCLYEARRKFSEELIPSAIREDKPAAVGSNLRTKSCGTRPSRNNASTHKSRKSY